MKFLVFAVIVIAAVFFSGCTGTDVASPSEQSPEVPAGIGIPGATLVPAPSNVTVKIGEAGGNESGILSYLIDIDTTAFWNGKNFETRYRVPIELNNTNCKSRDEYIQTEPVANPAENELIMKSGCKNLTFHYEQYKNSSMSMFGGKYWIKVDGGM